MLPEWNIGNGHSSPLLVIEIFVTVITRPLQLFVFLVTDVKRPLRIMTLVVTVVFKNRYGLDSSNGRTKRPLLIIGNACCSASVTDALLYNGLLAPVTNAVLPI